MKPPLRFRSLAAFALALVSWLGLALCVLSVRAQPEGCLPPPIPPLTLSAAVNWALQHNPALQTFRRNLGIAQAAVQIARQYPFNPIVQDYTWYAQGPAEAGVINPIFNEHTMRLDLELRRQGKYRRAMARAALTRTEWEIAAQELLTGILVTRAFNTLLYRQDKYRVLEEGAQLTEEVADLMKRLVELGGPQRSADLLLANADVLDARNALGPARSILVVAENDLRRALGMIDENLSVVGTLEKTFTTPPLAILIQAGLERRPDLHGLQFAVHEAEQRLNLEVANRWGNPSFGPAMEENETSVTFVGMWLIWQLPILNTRKGEIRQRGAELARAMQARHQGEVLVKQDVFTALARLAQAEETVKTFSTEALPKLRETLKEFDKLYAAGQPGVTLQQIIDVRRRLLRVRDAYLDALFELSQAQTDLAAAVADLSLADCRAVSTPPPSDTSGAGTAGQKPAAPAGEELPPPNLVPDK
jgi:outer membrane protein, heavy metal efflux system